MLQQMHIYVHSPPYTINVSACTICVSGSVRKSTTTCGCEPGGVNRLYQSDSVCELTFIEATHEDSCFIREQVSTARHYISDQKNVKRIEVWLKDGLRIFTAMGSGHDF